MNNNYFNKDNNTNKQSQPKKAPADDDLISRIFGRFLPTPEDIGLTRYDKDSRPENYPCKKDEWADLLPQDKTSNDPDLMLIRQLLAGTNLQVRPLQLVFSAQKDGWYSTSFHNKVDKKGPAVVLAKSTTGGVYGGYNPTGWVNLGEYRGSIAAFLFHFPKGDIKQRPVKLSKIAGAGMAQIDDGSGPKFGMEGLTIPLGKTKPVTRARSKLGLYYERLPNGVNSLFLNGGGEDELSELKVYVGVYDANERIPYSDAMPFSLN
eukprot:gene5559-7681_t